MHVSLASIDFQGPLIQSGQKTFGRETWEITDEFISRSVDWDVRVSQSVSWRSVLYLAVKMSAAPVRVTQHKFGTVDADQTEVVKFQLVNSNGAELHLISYGAAITNLLVPDKNGQLDDVTLGFDNLDGS